MTQSILFVCTGNVFRSMAAEYALRAQLGQQSSYRVESAGTEAKPKTIHPVISNRLIQKGTDPSAHVPQALTKAVIDRNDLIIAMGLGHREFIQKQFGLNVPLFNEVSVGEDTPILDLHEALPDWERDIEEARAYVESVIDHIWESVPALIARLPHFPGRQRPRRPWHRFNL
ncbi:MAG TPA: low molecular weight phosphatase family protein [Nitrospira sp.]|nr:low molecular weight phosphatase family protein [Nitrospira sp.]